MVSAACVAAVNIVEMNDVTQTSGYLNGAVTQTRNSINTGSNATTHFYKCQSHEITYSQG